MTNEQKVAYVSAQTALLLVELEGMKAENAVRASVGNAPAYAEDAFQRLFARYDVLCHNYLIGFFSDGGQ